MLFKLKHPRNVLSLMEETLSGRVMLVRLEHPENAKSPMVVILFGSVMLVKPVQLLNVEPSM